MKIFSVEIIAVSVCTCVSRFGNAKTHYHFTSVGIMGDGRWEISNVVVIGQARLSYVSFRRSFENVNTADPYLYAFLPLYLSVK